MMTGAVRCLLRFGKVAYQILVRRIPGLQGVLALPRVTIQGQAAVGRVEQGLHRQESNV